MASRLIKFLAFLSSLVLLATPVIGVFSVQTLTLSARPGCKEIQLSWNKVDGAQFYQPYMFLPDGTTYPLIDYPAVETTFTHKELEDGKEYCYQVKVYNADSKEIAKSNKTCSKPECKGNTGNNTTDDNCNFVLEYTIGNTMFKINNSTAPKAMEAPPQLKWGRTFLLAKYVVEEIKGASLSWDQQERKVSINTPLRGLIELWIGKKDARVDGKMVQIDPTNKEVVPFIDKGRTLLPFRFLGERLGAKEIFYNGELKSVRLTFDCKLDPSRTVIDPIGIYKTICGCIDSVDLVPARGTGVPALVTFLENCDPASTPLHYTVNSYLVATNSFNSLYDTTDTTLHDPRPTDGWDMPSYTGMWQGHIKPGTTNDRTWCAEITVNVLSGIIVSWNMYPEREVCCPSKKCACIYDYDIDVAPGFIRLFIQDDCIDSSANYHTIDVPFNLGCTNPPSGGPTPYKFYNYIGDYPTGTNNGPVNGVPNKRRWCFNYTTDGLGNLVSWEMTPDNCECGNACIDRQCAGCLKMLTPVPPCTGLFQTPLAWSAVFDHDCNFTTTNDQTTYTQADVSSTVNAGAIYRKLVTLWRACQCGGSGGTQTKIFDLNAEFDTGIKSSVDHNPTAGQLEIQFPAHSTKFDFIWIPSQDTSTVTKVSTIFPYPTLGKYLVTPSAIYGSPSRTTVDIDGNCWVGNRNCGSVVKILNIPVDQNGDSNINTSTGESDVKPWGLDEAIEYEVILDPSSPSTTIFPGVYKPCITAQSYYGLHPSATYPNYSVGPRGIAVDKYNNLWVGTNTTRKIYKIAPVSSVMTLSLYFDLATASYAPARNGGPYGAVVDGCGNLWVQCGSGVLKLQNATTLSVANPVYITPSSGYTFSPYGITISPDSKFIYIASLSQKHVYSIPVGVNNNGNIWVGGGSVPSIIVNNISKAGGRGLAFDASGYLWVARDKAYDGAANPDSVMKFVCNSTTGIVTEIPTHEVIIPLTGSGGNATPTGVSLAGDGRIWVPCTIGNEAVSFTPPPTTAGPAPTPIVHSIPGSHYTYSDMTGSILNSVTNPIGTWTTPYIDANCENPTWGLVVYHMSTPGIFPNNTSLNLYYSTATANPLSSGSWSTYAPLPLSFIPPTSARYLKIRVVFNSGTTGNTCPPTFISPILYDLKVSWSCKDVSLSCCADLCFDNQGKIAEVYPRAGEDPCCEPATCEWVCGCFKVGPNGNIFFDLDCNGADSQPIDISAILGQSSEAGSLYNFNSIGQYIEKMHDQEYWCADVCIVNGKAVKWRIDPNKPYPNCCEVKCEKICGCIFELGLQQGTTKYKLFFKKDCDPNGQIVTYFIDNNLKDRNLNLTIAQWRDQYYKNKKLCVDLCIDANNNVVWWEAWPDRDPCCLPTPCCEDVQLIIPATEPANVLSYGTFTATQCVNPGDKITFSRLEFKNNCKYPICIRIVGAASVTDFFIAKDFADYQNNIPITQPITIPANSTLQYLYGRFTVPPCQNTTGLTMFTVRQVDCATGQDIPGCGIKVAVNCCPNVAECCRDWELQIPSIEPANVMNFENVTATECAKPGTKVKFSRLVLKNNCSYPICVKFVSTIPDFFIASDFTNYTNGIPLTQPVTIPANSSLQYLYGHFTVSECNGATTIPAFKIVQVDCATGAEIGGDCWKTVSVKCCIANQSCCDWIFRIKPYVKIAKLQLCPGEEATLNYYEIFNACAVGSNNLNFSITWPNDGKIVSITTTPITNLAPQTSKDLTIKIKMPKCETGSTVNFPFVIDCRECGKKEVSISAICKDCTCCDWIIRTKPEVKLRPLELCAGETAVIDYYEFFNNCPAGSNPITVTSINSLTQGLSIGQPATPFTLQPQERKTLTLKLTMPDKCEPGKAYTFAFVVNTLECGEKKFTISATCKDCTCCEWGFEGRAGAGVLPAELCPGESVSTKITLRNNCPKDMQIQIEPGPNTSVSVRSVTVPANSTNSFALTFKMPDCKPGQTITASYTLTPPAPCVKRTVSYSVTCKDCRPCCDWLFRVMPNVKVMKLELCPGEEATIGYNEIFNACATGSNNLNFTITWPADGKITSISPTSITNLAPQTSTALSIAIKMPKCESGSSVNFPFVIDCRECGKKEVYITAYCKDCFCIDGKKITLKNIKNFPKEGFLTGRDPSATGRSTEIKIYYDLTDTRFNTIKDTDTICYEICYKEETSRSGVVTFKGIDIRLVPCPTSNLITLAHLKFLYASVC